jgi:hypothetical protein
MKKTQLGFIFFLFFILLIHNLKAVEIELLSIPDNPTPNSTLLIMPKVSAYFSLSLIDLLFDDISRKDLIIEKNKEFLLMKIPDKISIGNHQIKIILQDDYQGQLTINLVENTEPIYEEPPNYGEDPNYPDNSGNKPNPGFNPKPINPSYPIKNPPGGYPPN